MPEAFVKDATHIFVITSEENFAGGYTHGCLVDTYGFKFDGTDNLLDIMGEDGAPVYHEIYQTFVKDTKTITDTGDFGDVVVGMIAYLEGTDIVTGFYTVTACDENSVTFGDMVGDEDFTIGLPGSDPVDVRCAIGGAWPTVQASPIESGTTAEDNDCTVWSSKNEINLEWTPTGTGSIRNNTKMRWRAFTTSPGDMSPGGYYYGNALDGYKSENGLIPYMDNPNAAWKSWSGGDGEFSVVNIDGLDNVEVWGFKIHEVDVITGYPLIAIANTPKNIAFHGCKFDTAKHVLTIAVDYKTCLVDCWSGTNFRGVPWYNYISYAMMFKDCVLEGKSDEWLMYTDYYQTIINCIIIGTKGIAIYQRGAEVYNNTFVNCTTSGLQSRNTGGILNEWNNLFVSLATSDFAVYIESGLGTVTSDYSYAICTAGPYDGNAFHDATNNRSIIGPNSTATTGPSPLRNIAIGDFALRDFNLLHAGRPTFDGRRTHIGAVPPKFIKRTPRLRLRYTPGRVEYKP